MGYISIIGAGNWGTALACLLGEKEYDVMLWSHEKEVAECINKTGKNDLYLPDFVLPHFIHATSDYAEAVNSARYIINVVPTQHIRAVFTRLKPYINNDVTIVSASKGIENDTYCLPSTIIKEVLGLPVSVLSGPSFAKEVLLKKPTAVTLASESKKDSLLLQELFNTDFFRVYTHQDVIGVEIGGALKNVIAIASGICDGLGLGNNSRAALLTRGLSEITRLGLAMGAQTNTFSGLSGLGDLILTCTALMSRNYTVGYKLGKGEKLSDIIAHTRTIAEGVTTSKSAYELSKKMSIEMPITEQVYNTLYNNLPPDVAVKELMTRSLKPEFYGY
ncbi:MAG: NAD(P)-dependent glycerol-3-phosphate dehydrogenase [Thermodesulfovibrionales bacterium]|nr:NAD(P)-dependent glycerol-3-phosphate dehydrogenase [Thermodesulfovibrionales bacterium]